MIASLDVAEHDTLFKRAFRVPAHLAGELAAVLPPELLEALELGSLEAVPSHFVDGRLRERFADALFRARFHGRLGYVCILLEHQSTSDRWMALRLLEEIVRIWREVLRHEPERTQLPPIVCVVVHHSEAGWTAARRLHELVDGLDLSAELRRFVPDFEFVVDDLTEVSDEGLLGRPLATFPKLVLWALRDARSAPRLLAHLAAWAPELDRLSRESVDDATTLLRYVLLVAGEQPFEEVRQRIIEAAPAARTPMATAGERLIEEGVRRGLAEGLARGKAEGKAEGVIAVLQARGVWVSPEDRARILACDDLATVERWLRVAVSCTCADALFSH